MSPRYDAVHTRTVALVDGDYWVVHDRLRAGRAHSYTAHWHLDHDPAGPVDVRRTPGQTVVTAPSVTFVVPGGYGDVELGAGWVSPAYGVRHPAPVVHVSAMDRRDADLVTVVVPGRDAPMVTVHPGDRGIVVDVVPARRSGARLELTPAGVVRTGRGDRP